MACLCFPFIYYILFQVAQASGDALMLFSQITFLFFSSLEECGRYLETIKVYENKPADSIREQMDTDYLSRVLGLFLYLIESQLRA